MFQAALLSKVCVDFKCRIQSVFAHKSESSKFSG